MPRALAAPRLRPPAAALAVALASGALAGCGLLNFAAETPGKIASAFSDEEAAEKFDPARLAQRLMRFYDVFEFEIARSTDEFARVLGTPEARVQALDWYIEYTSAGMRRATVAQPYAGLFDLTLLITAMRDAHENLWLARYGEADQAMIAGLKSLESAIWNLAGESMSAKHVEETRALVDAWLAAPLDQRIVDAGRLPGLGERLEAKKEGGFASSLTDLVRVDPLAGLGPMEREVAQAREMFERIFFFAQRFPKLAEARMQLAALRASRTDPARVALEGWERASRSAESLAATAATLPEELARQREGLVADLEKAQEPVKQILAETRGTAESTRALSDSLEETLVALGVFLDRFEKDPNAPPEPEPDPDAPPRKPFDIAEYGIAAERIGVAVGELNATLASLDQSLPQLERALDEAAQRGKSTVDHAYRRALELLTVALLGGAAVVILVRWLGRPRGAPRVSEP